MLQSNSALLHATLSVKANGELPDVLLTGPGFALSGKATAVTISGDDIQVLVCSTTKRLSEPADLSSQLRSIMETVVRLAAAADRPDLAFAAAKTALTQMFTTMAAAGLLPDSTVTLETVSHGGSKIYGTCRVSFVNGTAVMYTLRPVT